MPIYYILYQLLSAHRFLIILNILSPKGKMTTFIGISRYPSKKEAPWIATVPPTHNNMKQIFCFGYAK